MKTIFLFTFFALQSFADDAIQIGYSKFSADDTLQLIVQEVETPLPSGHIMKSNVTRVPSSLPNPFNISASDYNAGLYLSPDEKERTPPPTLSEEDANWFASMVEKNQSPDIFVIGGHQVISEGWHNHVETEFLFLPTLFDTLERYANARAYFDKIKFAVLGGCNTMTNLEPHKESNEFDSLMPSLAQKKTGDYLTPEEIKTIYFSGLAGKNFVIGKRSSGLRWNSLEFYKNRLASEYGPGSESYEYTRGPKNEKCLGPGKYERCVITDVDRIFPESGLWDGSHRFNYPFMMRRLFRNAALVIGYTSASPNDDRRALITKTAFDDVRKELNALKKPEAPLVRNILVPLVNDQQSNEIKEMIIKSLRKHWTQRTFEMNRGRPAGSITPIFPDLDGASIFAAVVDKAPAYEPYRSSENSPVLMQLN